MIFPRRASRPILAYIGTYVRVLLLGRPHLPRPRPAFPFQDTRKSLPHDPDPVHCRGATAARGRHDAPQVVSVRKPPARDAQGMPAGRAASAAWRITGRRPRGAWKPPERCGGLKTPGAAAPTRPCLTPGRDEGVGSGLRLRRRARLGSWPSGASLLPWAGCLVPMGRWIRLRDRRRHCSAP